MSACGLGCTSFDSAEVPPPASGGGGGKAGSAGSAGAAGASTAGGQAGSASGAAGTAGQGGAGGSAGQAGTAGAGQSGAAGAQAGGGQAGDAGQAGVSGQGGTSGAGGTSGQGGDSGAAGDSGASGEGGEAGASGAGGQGGAGQGGQGGSGGAGQGGAGAGGAGAAGSGGGGAAGSSGAAGQGGSAAECAVASDCDAARGPAPCGAWACEATFCEASAPGCTDADRDGYGTGPGCACAGLDCDDNDATLHATATKDCYSGPPKTAGTGACRAGTQSCVAGAWGMCVGEITPSGEACNNEDDDCNGLVDDNLGSFQCGLGACAASVLACANGVAQSCVPGTPASNDATCNGKDDDCDGVVDEDCSPCIPVSLGGNDGTANGTPLKPFATIQAAILWAASHQGPKNVCVAAGTACGAAGKYATSDLTPLTMANGVNVLGNYESTTWTRCGSGTTTTIQLKSPQGVLFPSSIQSTTALEGFSLERPAATTVAAVTIDGAKNVVLSSLNVPTTSIAVSNAYGVNVINGGDARITRSRIEAGLGDTEAVGVRVVGARAKIDGNCTTLDSGGHCTSGCVSANLGIRGRSTPGPGTTYGVLLRNAPGSSVEATALCLNASQRGATLRIDGDASQVVVRGSLINAFGGVDDSHGVWMEDCNDKAPWIVDNHVIAANGAQAQSRSSAVRAVGACHPVIDSNEALVGGIEGSVSSTNAVSCVANAALTPSRCVVLGNAAIRGAQGGSPPMASGVWCEDGSCSRVARNVIPGARGTIAYGIYLKKTGTFVDANTIAGGCSPSASGIYADDAWARIQNNVITGYSGATCGAGGNSKANQSWGMQILTAPGGRELDVHSNSIDGGGVNACTSYAIQLGVSIPTPGSNKVSAGIFRNNILRAGSCSTARYGFYEAQASSDPRIFQNNDLDPYLNPTALYFDEASSALVSAAAVDALNDVLVSNTLSADPAWTNYPTDLHLLPVSPCIKAGTAEGAPGNDLDGKKRDPAAPSVGAYEP